MAQSLTFSVDFTKLKCQDSSGLRSHVISKKKHQILSLKSRNVMQFEPDSTTASR